MTRELILLRHAKSAWPIGVADENRPLNERGERDSTEIADWFESKLPIDLILVSPALRTSQTADHAFGTPALSQIPRVTAPNLYEAGWWDIAETIRSVESDVQRLVLVGHNPGSAEAALQLAGPGAHQGALNELHFKFPTCSAAVLISDEPWANWDTDCAKLTEFRTPKGGVFH